MKNYLLIWENKQKRRGVYIYRCLWNITYRLSVESYFSTIPRVKDLCAVGLCQCLFYVCSLILFAVPELPLCPSFVMSPVLGFSAVRVASVDSGYFGYYFGWSSQRTSLREVNTVLLEWYWFSSKTTKSAEVSWTWWWGRQCRRIPSLFLTRAT